MAKSKKRSASGLMSEAAKKAGRSVGRAAKKVVGKKPSSRKSASGLMSEAAKKAGRAGGDTAKKAVGKRPSRVKKSGSK